MSLKGGSIRLECQSCPLLRPSASAKPKKGVFAQKPHNL